MSAARYFANDHETIRSAVSDWEPFEVWWTDPAEPYFEWSGDDLDGWAS